MVKSKHMEKADRDLMLKIAKRLGVLEKDVREVKKFIKEIDEEVIKAEEIPPEIYANLPEPYCQISTTINRKDLNAINDSQVYQMELRKHLTQFCRQHGITNLKVEYREQNQITGSRIELPPTQQ